MLIDPSTSISTSSSDSYSITMLIDPSKSTSTSFFSIGSSLSPLSSSDGFSSFLSGSSTTITLGPRGSLSLPTPPPPTPPPPPGCLAPTASIC